MVLNLLKKASQSVSQKDQEKTLAPSSSRKIILKQGQSPGDVLTFSSVIRDLKKAYPKWQVDVKTPCPEIWENNPRLTPLNENEKGVEVFDINYNEINKPYWARCHFIDAFRHDMEEKLGVSIKPTGRKPELWISDQEKGWINQPEQDLGWKGKFWVLNAGHKPDNELKQYHKWQEVVDILNKFFKGKVKIVQIGHKDHNHPKLDGVLSLVGKTDLRQLIRLIYNAEGTIGPISFQFVASAALDQPSVVVMGGKEDITWHLYPHIKHIYSNGSLDCCKFGGCWLGGNIGKCKNLVNGVPKCFDIIKPRTIADAVKSYYQGGMLKF